MVKTTRVGVIGRIKQHTEDYLSEFVYGGIDGAVTTFAVVAGASGAGFSVTVILVLGFANLIADGFSMGVGSYLSTKSELEVKTKHGEDVSDEPSSVINGATTYFSFILFGLIPLLAYTVEEMFDFVDFNNTFVIACVMTALAFTVIGVLKSKVAQTSMVRGVAETLILGIIAAVFAYSLGNILETLIG
jgi:vacuolar iron transporter family protein